MLDRLCITRQILFGHLFLQECDPKIGCSRLSRHFSEWLSNTFPTPLSLVIPLQRFRDRVQSLHVANALGSFEPLSGNRN